MRMCQARRGTGEKLTEETVEVESELVPYIYNLS